MGAVLAIVFTACGLTFSTLLAVLTTRSILALPITFLGATCIAFLVTLALLFLFTALLFVLVALVILSTDGCRYAHHRNGHHGTKHKLFHVRMFCLNK